jgi:hypothetical protein
MEAGMQAFEICRPGTFMDATGRVVSVTEDALREMSMGYNTKVRRAPLVVGHPKMDDPAYGWVRGLEYRDGALLAMPEQVDEKFSSAVKDGRFPNRSAAFFAPNTPNNPTPGRYYLKHVGFLGAAQPAVDGLRPVEFSAFDGDSGHDLVVSLAGYEGYIRHQERRRLTHEHEMMTLTDQLINKAILRGTEREAFVALASHFCAVDSVILFGSGEDAEQADAFTLLRRLMENRAPLVQLGVYDRCDREGPLRGETTVNLAMPAGITVDQSRADLHAKAVAYKHANGCDYQTAVRAVSK